jgi:hypothetical protein
MLTLYVQRITKQTFHYSHKWNSQRNTGHCKHHQLEQKYFLSHILVATGWMTRVWFLIGAGTFISSLPSHLDWLELIQSPMLRVPGPLSSWVKWPKCEADWPSYMVVLRLRCTSLPSYVFIAEGLIKFWTTLPLPYHAYCMTVLGGRFVYQLSQCNYHDITV